MVNISNIKDNFKTGVNSIEEYINNSLIHKKEKRKKSIEINKRHQKKSRNIKKKIGKLKIPLDQ